MQGTREELGRLVTERRLRLGITRQEDLARVAGLKSRTTIAAVEKGKSVKPWTLDRLDVALGWRIGSSQRFLQDGTPPEISEEIDPHEEVIKSLPHLSDERKALLLLEYRQEKARNEAIDEQTQQDPKRRFG